MFRGWPPLPYLEHGLQRTMGKRFTETSKWSDPWYRELSPASKHGWNYLLDNCDAAGVISLDRALADFQIGEPVEWESLIDGSEGRIERLGGRKLWVTGFVSFQYGRLSEDCKAHRPVFASIEKHNLNERVSKGYPKGTEPLKEKDKEKEQDKDKEKEGVQGKPKAADPFDGWWAVVHAKTGREVAKTAYAKAVAKLRDAGRDDPHAYLLDRMLAFARSPNARPPDRTPIHPATWLNQGRYDDDPETWNHTTKGNGNGRRNGIVPGQRYDPTAAASKPGVLGF